MKTLSFHELVVGRKPSRALLHLDTAKDGIRFAPGLHLIAAPNGCGKTSLLQTIAGVLRPLAGGVRADGVALEPETDVLYVSEYLTFPKFIFPMEWIEFMAGRARLDHTDEWINRFALKAQMRSYIGRLSQGERRKVTWLGADACRKPVLLLDEPLDGLDLLAIRSARDMVRKWKQEGRTVCVVAHQMAELLDLSDEVYLVRDKCLQPWSKAVGSPASGTPHEEFRRKVLEFYAAAP